MNNAGQTMKQEKNKHAMKLFTIPSEIAETDYRMTAQSAVGPFGSTVSAPFIRRASTESAYHCAALSQSIGSYTDENGGLAT